MAALYTVVDCRTSQPFVLHSNRPRPAVVAFRTYPSAHFTARALEQREMSLGATLERGDWSAVNDLVPAPFSLVQPENMQLRAWDSITELVELCRSMEADVMYCTGLDVNSMTDPIEFVGHVYFTGEK
jgi:hypothetical protein